ncbi:MAG: hypothetical protein ACREPB_01085 [Arenimonas sp.]
MQTIVLLCLMAMQAWLIYRVETALSAGRGTVVSETNRETGGGIDAKSGENQQTVLLAQISSRLASLEATRTTEVSSAQSGSLTNVSGSAEAAAADKKLLAMLPKEPMTQEELMLFQAQFGQFPAAEQHQLSAALARAINNGRIQPRNH